MLVIWADDLDNIIPIARDFEDKLIRLVWRSRTALSSSASAVSSGSLAQVPPPYQASATALKPTDEKKDLSDADVKVVETENNRIPPPKKAFGWFGWTTSRRKKGLTQRSDGRTEHVDVEAGGEWRPENRPIRLFAPVYNGLGAGLSLFFVGSGVNVLVREWMLDGDATRFALLAAAPFLCCVSLFFSLQIITNISYVIGPVAQFHENSSIILLLRPSRANRSITICRTLLFRCQFTRRA